MPLDPARLCACHGLPMYLRSDNGKPRCNVKRKAAQDRYARTAKGGATARRYALTDKGRAVWRRYDARRLFVSGRTIGVAASADQARRINAYVRSRLHDFTRQQSGAEVEAAAADGVPAETRAGTD